MSYQLPEGISLDSLVQGRRDNKVFYIAVAGGKPELEDGFYYGDANCQFFFYTKMILLDEQNYQLDIFTATTRRLQGGEFQNYLLSTFMISKKI